MKWHALGITVIHLAIALCVCTFVYNHHVIDGNWGSTSDILVAIFTGIISWATTLLFVVAFKTANSWKNQKKYDLASELLSLYISFYQKLVEHRELEVQIYIMIGLLENNNAELRNNSYRRAMAEMAGSINEGPSPIDKMQMRRCDMLHSSISQNETRLGKCQSDIDLLIRDIEKIIFHFSRTDKGVSFLRECRKLRSDFYEKMAPFFMQMSSHCFERRVLPRIPEDENIKKFKDVVYVTPFNELQKFADLMSTEKERYAFADDDWDSIWGKYK